MKAKSFLIRLFWLTLLSATMVHIFTVLIDPYQKAGFNPVNRLVGPKDRFDLPMKLEKLRDTFEFFIVGSSRTGTINISTIEKITNQKTFNYSFAAASIEDYITIVNHIVHTQKSKTIYLQLDFYSFKETFSRMHYILETPLKKYLAPYFDLNKNTQRQLLFFDKTYFSLKAFTDAGLSLKSYIKNIIKIGAHPHETPTPQNPTAHEAIIPTPPEKVKKGKVRLLRGYFMHEYDEFSINESKLKKWLGFIKKMTAENKIKLIVSMSPMNQEHLAKLQKNKKLTKHWLKVKKIIAEVFGSYHDFNNCSANSFRGRLYWNDSVHPSRELSEIIMRVILDPSINTNIPQSFGMRVTRQTIDDYLLNLNDLCTKGK